MSSKQELVRLATWGPKALSEAVDDVCAALAADGVNPVERLVVCDLMGWGLQRDPAHRPPSCKKLLRHSFFKLFKTKAPETKDDGAASEEKEGGGDTPKTTVLLNGNPILKTEEEITVTQFTQPLTSAWKKQKTKNEQKKKQRSKKKRNVWKLRNEKEKYIKKH